MRSFINLKSGRPHIDGKFHTVLKARLLHEAVDMGTDGPAAHIERIRNLLIGISIHDLTEYVQLT